MTLQQLDDVLRSWKTRLSLVAENLMELQADCTYQSLTGTGGLPQQDIAGTTEARAGMALRTVNELFLRFGLLQSTISRAEEIRSGLPAFFGSEAKLQELHRLLFTPTIEVESRELPLAERHLLSGAHHAQRLAPEELLGSMTRTFAQVRDTVAEVGLAWTDFAAGADRVASELGRLRGQAVLPSNLLSAALQELEIGLDAAQQQAQDDPLGALSTLRTRLEPALASVNQRVLAAAQVRDQVRAARSRWQLLEALHQEATIVAAEAGARLGVAAGEPGLVPEEKLHAVGAWLSRLERKCDEGAVEAVAVGVRNWTAAAEGCSAQDRAVLSACAASLASRGELRGRLEALNAKSQAYGLDRNKGVSSLYQVAKELLSARPLDFTQATAALGQLEQSLLVSRVPRASAKVVGSR